MSNLYILLYLFDQCISVPKPRIIEGLTGRRTVIPCSNVASTVRYEWQKDGTRLPGEISSSLVLSNTSYRHIGLYQCFAFNSDGTGLISRIQLNVKGQLICYKYMHAHNNVARLS